MSAPIIFPRRPERAIYVYPHRDGSGRWVARFAGDRFTPAFIIEARTRWGLLPDVQWASRRCGLPIVDLTRKDLRAVWRSWPPDLAVCRAQALRQRSSLVGRSLAAFDPDDRPRPGGWAA